MAQDKAKAQLVEQQTARDDKQEGSEEPQYEIVPGAYVKLLSALMKKGLYHLCLIALRIRITLI